MMLDRTTLVAFLALLAVGSAADVATDAEHEVDNEINQEEAGRELGYNKKDCGYWSHGMYYSKPCYNNWKPDYKYDDYKYDDYHKYDDYRKYDDYHKYDDYKYDDWKTYKSWKSKKHHYDDYHYDDWKYDDYHYDDYYYDDWHGKTDFGYKEKCVLTACVELYYENGKAPAYNGGWNRVNAYGKVQLKFNGYSPEEKHKFDKNWYYNSWTYDGTDHSMYYSLYGMEPKTSGKLSIRKDQKCKGINTNKKRFYFNKKAVKNPFRKLTYKADYYGDASGYYHVDNGYHCTENVGRTVYVSMPNGGYGCGQLVLGDKNCKKHHKMFYA